MRLLVSGLLCLLTFSTTFSQESIEYISYIRQQFKEINAKISQSEVKEVEILDESAE